ncbi:SDR family NAD(P)-dependent oxidoreductase [Tumebacillus permanentifrigoris]|uniref:NAD(P)-dependent dehydrogenase (Short-subunit alcohol dehydrogenase family) n=1 Tax=Tumebacillus permanentifrigoris TaxID=378543 RepID=A0A316D4N8_9BACL|nr:SDR family oxidoreductase [Tumebacillus permanentifrigoris]PWK07433.1 NAD(P)-dependent dehydrogenase (short-subunit alcohol dehydrogenase family) [Tumebacillus permanentifrigoris]
MSKAIFLTNGDQTFNRLIANHLLGQGHRVTVLFQEATAAESYLQETAEEQRERLHVLVEHAYTLDTVTAVLAEAGTRMEGLDVLIHGNEMLNEEDLFEQDPLNFGEMISETFRRIYLFNRVAVSTMMRRKSGSIIFPMFFDVLHYAGYPSSPVLNQGKISFMKCLSKELTAFKLAVNAMTFGYYDENFDSPTKKGIKEAVEIFGLKPTLLSWQEMIPALDFLVNPPVKNLGGQNIHISAGNETIL